MHHTPSGKKNQSSLTENFKAIGPVFEEKSDFLKMMETNNNNTNILLKQSLCPINVSNYAKQIKPHPLT